MREKLLLKDQKKKRKKYKILKDDESDFMKRFFWTNLKINLDLRLKK